MQQHLYASRDTGLYRETAPFDAVRGNAYAFVWPHSRALLGTLALAGVPGQDRRADVKDRLAGLAWYWDGRAYASYVLPPYGGGGDRYSDDNTWIALALVQAHRMGLNPSLRRAQQVFGYLQSAWDPERGGLFWVEQGRGFGLQNHDRGAGATAGAASLGFLIGETRSASRMLDWVHDQLAASPAGPFYNAVRQDGSIDTNLWSYNQGVVLGAHVQQYRATGHANALGMAEAIAAVTLDAFGNFTGQPPSFNAMYFQDLLTLHAVSANERLQARIVDALRGYAEWTWDAATGAHDPETHLFYFTDAGEPNRGRQPARLQDQGAMVQLYALVGWDSLKYVNLT